MARVFIEGFETGDAGLWDECSAPSAVTSNTSSRKMTGKYCLDDSGITSPIQYIKYLPASKIYFVALSINANATAASAICSLRSGTNNIISLCRTQNALGNLILRFGDDSDGEVLATGESTKGAALNYRSNIMLKIDISVAGTLTVLVTVNGKTAIDITGALEVEQGVGVIFTPSSGSPVTLAESAVATAIIAGTATIDRLLIGSSSEARRLQSYVDDIVVDNAEAPKKPRVLGLKPIAAGTVTQFTSSNGEPNWQNVSETPGDDETYVMSNIPGQQDLYPVTDLPDLFTDIRCVQISARAWFEGNAAARRVGLLVKPASQNTIESPPISLSEYPAGYSVLMANNPNTSLPFTHAEVQGMEIGVEAVAPA